MRRKAARRSISPLRRIGAPLISLAGYEVAEVFADFFAEFRAYGTPSILLGASQLHRFLRKLVYSRDMPSASSSKELITPMRLRE
jgi:hypothetical protein